MMERTEVIQTFLDTRGLTTYLEIGIRSGHTFLRIRAARKIAVEPDPKIGWFKKLRWRLRNSSNRSNRLFRMTSDEFFSRHSAIIERHGLDIAFVDGLHTYEQSLKDVENCLRFLNDGGVVLMHDCSPPSKAAATTAESLDQVLNSGRLGSTDTWCGDVYKTILHLRASRPDLRVCVIDCDHGIGVVQPGEANDVLDLTPEQIAAMTYEEFDVHRKQWLNLQSPDRLFDLAQTSS